MKPVFLEHSIYDELMKGNYSEELEGELLEKKSFLRMITKTKRY